MTAALFPLFADLRHEREHHARSRAEEQEIEGSVDVAEARRAWLRH